jgi:hypothetical protein
MSNGMRTFTGDSFKYCATPPLGFPGAFEWVQVVTKSNFACFSASGTKPVTEPTPSLDSSYPYSGAASTTDSPSVPLPPSDTKVTWDFAAQMFLMWRPGLTNDIYVPLGSVTWGVFQDAAQNTSSHAWSVQSDSKPTVGNFVQSSTFPCGQIL